MTRSKLKEVVEKGVVCILSFSLSWEIEACSWLFIEKKCEQFWSGVPFEIIMCGLGLLAQCENAYLIYVGLLVGATLPRFSCCALA